MIEVYLIRDNLHSLDPDSNNEWLQIERNITKIELDKILSQYSYIDVSFLIPTRDCNYLTYSEVLQYLRPERATRRANRG